MIAPHLARYLRFLALAALAAGFVGAVGYLPTRNLAGDPGVAAMALGLALCWAASALGGVPVLLAEAALAAPAAPGRDAEPKLPVVVALGSMLVRLIAVLGFALAAVFAGLVPKEPLLLWTAIGYLALLGVDTWYVLATARPRGIDRPAPEDLAPDDREATEDATSNVTERS